MPEEVSLAVGKTGSANGTEERISGKPETIPKA